MATLKVSEVAEGSCTGSRVSLREWLDGRWAILFSHPDDFVQCELELDRWLGIVGSAFTQARICPLALPRRNCPVDQGWVSQLSGGASVVALHERAEGPFSLDFHTRRLQAEVERLEQRFAMIIDPMLRRRRTVTYGAAEQLPSPLDLIRITCRLRNEAAHDSRVDHESAALAHERAASPSLSLRYRSYGAYAFA